MLRKEALALAVAFAFGSFAIVTSAFARGDGTDRSFEKRFNGRNAAGSDAYYGSRTSGLRANSRGYRQRDVWGHWGNYYGPMIHGP